MRSASLWTCLTLVLAVAAGAAETIELGGKQVPAEKFHVFVAFGDSNTFGSGNAPEAWTSPRAWMIGRDGEWVQATSAVLRSPDSKREPSHASTGWWVLRYLTEHYPDHHFGLMQYCNTGVGEGMTPGEVVGKVYDPMIAYLDPYVGKFHFIGVVMESGMTRRNFLDNFDKMRAWFKEDLAVDRVPVVISGWRLNAYNFWPSNVMDVRGTREALPHVEGNFAENDYRPTGWFGIRNATELVRSRDDVALIFPFNSAMRDNRHMKGRSEHGQWGHDEFNKRFFHALVAHGWAVPGTEPDTTAPSVPSRLRTDNLWQEGVTLSWDASTDNLAVRGYEVFINGEKAPWLPTLPDDAAMVTCALPRHPLAGLEPGRRYELKVRAVDFANNRSGFSESVSVRLPSDRVEASMPIRVNLGGPAAGGWVADKAYRDGGGYGYVLSPGGVYEEQNQRYTNRTGPIADAFAEGDPERTVLGWFRRSPNVYRFDVPNGSYRVTWLIRVPHYRLKQDADDTFSKPSYDFKHEVPENHTLRDFDPRSGLGKLFNESEPYGDIGRAPARTYNVTDGVLIANPLDTRAIGNSGWNIYGVMVEPLE